MKIIKFDPDLPTLDLGPMHLKKSTQRESTSRFGFRSLDGRDIAPKEWLLMWAALYPPKYIHEHDKLIQEYESVSAAFFVRIGRWKDSAESESKWKANVASVAYQIWMQAAKELPKCPEENRVADFLQNWSKREYTDDYGKGARRKRFGLSRATTLLYFISGKRFPIFDSRVRIAMKRLLNSPAPNSIPWYMDSYRPLFSQIVNLCGAKDVREVDKALFSFGGRIVAIPI